MLDFLISFETFFWVSFYNINNVNTLLLFYIINLLIKVFV